MGYIYYTCQFSAIYLEKGQKSTHLINISNFFGISTYFYIENDGQNIKFFIFKNLSKTLYFRDKTVIISLFLVRFQIRLNYLTVLFILHVTKEKISKSTLDKYTEAAK